MVPINSNISAYIDVRTHTALLLLLLGDENYKNKCPFTWVEGRCIGTIAEGREGAFSF